MIHGSPIIPTLRYRDAQTAIDFLCTAFGFERHLVVPGDGDTIAHAQLTLPGGGMIMLGSARDDSFGEMQSPPRTPESQVTQSPYVIVADVDEHCRRATCGISAVMIRGRRRTEGTAPLGTLTLFVKRIRELGRHSNTEYHARRALTVDGAPDGADHCPRSLECGCRRWNFFVYGS